MRILIQKEIIVMGKASHDPKRRLSHPGAPGFRQDRCNHNLLEKVEHLIIGAAWPTLLRTGLFHRQIPV
jgi:hypothetical protein